MCLTADKKVFFDYHKQLSCKESIVAVEKALSLCSVCQVSKDCLRFATDNKITVGIWGGIVMEKRYSN